MSSENKNHCAYSHQIHAKLAQHNEYGGILGQDNELDEDQTITSLQNLWHKKGYNGCIFSQVIAQAPESYHWQASIVDTLGKQTAEEIDRLINEAVENPTTKLLSIIFPSVTNQEDLTRLVEILAYETSTIFLLNDEAVDQFVALAFRVALKDNQVLAWVMGFGPQESFAATRQAPYTEIVIPVKPKPDNTYHRHNQDKDSAHVADQHIDLDEKVLERLWFNTFKKTRKVLGHEPNVFSGARTTFTVHESEWQKINKSRE